MSVANNTLLGIAASTIPDHPKAPEWIASSLVMVDEMLATKVGPAGEWPESIAHYANVATTPLLLLSMVAKNAGLKDFVNDERHFADLMQRIGEPVTHTEFYVPSWETR